MFAPFIPCVCTSLCLMQSKQCLPGRYCVIEMAKQYNYLLLSLRLHWILRKWTVKIRIHVAFSSYLPEQNTKQYNQVVLVASVVLHTNIMMTDKLTQTRCERLSRIYLYKTWPGSSYSVKRTTLYYFYTFYMYMLHLVEMYRYSSRTT